MRDTLKIISENLQSISEQMKLPNQSHYFYARISLMSNESLDVEYAWEYWSWQRNVVICRLER